MTYLSGNYSQGLESQESCQASHPHRLTDHDYPDRHTYPDASPSSDNTTATNSVCENLRRRHVLVNSKGIHPYHADKRLHLTLTEPS